MADDCRLIYVCVAVTKLVFQLWNERLQKIKTRIINLWKFIQVALLLQFNNIIDTTPSFVAKKSNIEIQYCHCKNSDKRCSFVKFKIRARYDRQTTLSNRETISAACWRYAFVKYSHYVKEPSRYAPVARMRYWQLAYRSGERGRRTPGGKREGRGRRGANK